MRLRTARSALVVVSVFMLGTTGVAVAQTDQRGVDPMQGLSLVEVKVDSLNEAMLLQLDAERYGIEFNDHYRRDNPDGSVTVTVFGTDETLDRLADAGYDIGATIEGPRTYEDRIDERQADVRQERRADAAALDQTTTAASDENELVVLRVDYFENYAGRFLSVEAKTRLGGTDPTTGLYSGPELSLSFNRGKGTPIDSSPRLMAVNVDPDTEPNTYIEHRELVRIGEVGTTEPRKPTRIRVGSSTGASIEADVETWLGGGLPPMGSRYIKDFTTRYMDPSEVYDRFEALAREFPNISQLIPLPYKTNGYQRKAQANMNGGQPIGSSSPTAQAGQTVVLTSRAWGHEGGNDITAEFRDPGVPSASLSVSVTGKDILVNLATDATGARTSTVAEVIAAINADAAASQLVLAHTYRGSTGGGVVLPRAKVNLSDFLATATNAHVQRGPFKYSVMRIGKKRNGSKVGVFLFCQQHAREWATPLTCLETAEQLLRNYAIDRKTRQLVDNLDIFILPSANPDGSHYSLHNFTQQRRTMTNWCVEGGEETDNPFAPDFWTPRVNPGTGLPYTNTDPASRNAWGVDLNRNNSVGTIFDGYIGASYSCTSDVYTGPGEVSEPEMKNEHWIADTFPNIKFSNNIHSFGGYFMWAPGAYLPNRDEGELVHANIGVEKYFFEAGDQILNRIKDHRNTAILPARTGPIADVLYSAGGNSADDHWYRRGVIAYSFETGADRYFTNFNTTIPAGATGVRLSTNIGGYEYLKAGDKLTFGAGGANPETRTVAQVVRPNPPSPQPNVLWTEPLANTHVAPVRIEGAALQTAVGFQPDYATEGKHEALEFAAGNYGLLEEAYEYAKDDEDPKVRMTGPRRSRDPIETTFEWINEPSVIHYTTNGSTPTESSAEWDSTGPREPGQTFRVTETTTFRWRAEDIKGNVSYGKQQFEFGRGQGDDDDDD